MNTLPLICAEKTLISSPIVQMLKNERDKRRVQSAPDQPSISEIKPKKCHRLKIIIDEPEFYAHQKLRRFAYEPQPESLDRRTDKRIRKLLPKDLSRQFPKFVDQLLQDVNREYGIGLRNICAEQKIKPLESDEDKILDYSQMNRETPSRFNEFHERKAFLENRLFITHPLFRIINDKIACFPEFLIDYSDYRDKTSIQLAILRTRIREDLELTKNAHILQVARFVSQQLRKGTFLRRLNPENWVQFIRSLCYFIQMKIMDILSRTTQRFVSILQHPNLIPTIKINISFTNCMDVSPTVQQIFKFHHTLIDILGTYVIDLPEILDINPELIPDKITVQLPEYIVDLVHSNTDLFLEENLCSLKEYLESVEDSFKILWDEKFLGDFENINVYELSFADCCEKVKYIKTFKDKVFQLLPNRYFSIGIVSQVDFIDSICRRISKLIDHLLSKLVEKNYRDNMDICQEFEKIQQHATKIPVSTKELIEMGTYMVQAKEKHIAELNDRVVTSILQVFILLEMTPISDDHMKLNVQTIIWSEKITRIVEENTTMFEQRKNELEEELQRQIDELTKNVQIFMVNLQLLDDMSDFEQTESYISYLKEMSLEIDNFNDKQNWINKEETLFKFPLSIFPDLEECKEIIFTFTDLIYICFKWRRTYLDWMDGPWENLEFNSIREKLEFYDSKLTHYQKSYTTRIRQQIADGYTRRFKGNVDDPDVHNHPSPIKICAKAISLVNDFKPHLELIKILACPALLQRHWDEMSQIYTSDITPDAGTTLRKVIEKNTQPFLSQFEIISVASMKELKLQENLAAMKNEWKLTEFEMIDNGFIRKKIITNLDLVFDLLDEHIAKTLTMRSSVFVKPVELEVNSWYAYLKDVKKVIRQWLQIQNYWLRLIPILTCPEIVQELPRPAVIFEKLHETLTEIINEMNQKKYIQMITASLDFHRKLVEIEAKLEKIRLGIDQFIQEKRLYFSRFFFLTSNELLEILSYSHDFTQLQSYFQKVFPGIEHLIEDNNQITFMASSKGDQLKFSKSIKNFRKTGIWNTFLDIERDMRQTVREEICKCIQDYQLIPRGKWILKWSQQAVLIVGKIFWAREIESILRTKQKSNLVNYRHFLEIHLNELASLLRSKEISLGRKSVICSMLLQEFYGLEVIKKISSSPDIDMTCFEWITQLKYFWNQSNLFVNIFHFSKNYEYEYLGNQDSLVQDPLTDRCYQSLITAYQLQLNGALISSNVTGKTEIFKNLCNIFGNQYVIYNCRNGIRYRTIYRLIQGLTSTGAWLCLDDFNFIKIGSLSVMAQYLQTIYDGLKSASNTITLESSALRLIPSSFLCITCERYSYFCQMPNNIRSIFRPIVKHLPNFLVISEAFFVSLGFTNAKILAKKLIMLLDTASTVLNKTYDFGIRTLKEILQCCKQQVLDNFDSTEQSTVVFSLENVFMVQLSSDDRETFERITKLFFGTFLKSTSNWNEEQLIFDELHLTLSDYLKEKVIAIRENLNFHSYLILTGDSFSGKSTILKVLTQAKRVQTHIIFQKTLSHSHLFGYYNASLMSEWNDGIFTKTLRDCGSNESWIIFDGPIEDYWINSLYSLTDVSRKLCLQYGEQLQIKPQIRVICETEHLEHLSPNIISRFTVVHLDQEKLGWRIVLDKWTRFSPQAVWNRQIPFISALFSWVLSASLNYIRTNVLIDYYFNDANIVQTVLILFETNIKDAFSENPEDIKYIVNWIQAALCISFIWTIFSLMNQQQMSKFDEFFRRLWKNQLTEYPQPKLTEKIDLSFPIEGLLLDFFYVYKGKGVWKPYTDMIRAPKIEDVNLETMLVPTVSASRLSQILSSLTRYKYPFLLFGPTGSGKTRYVEYILKNKLPRREFDHVIMSLVGQFDQVQAQQLFLSKIPVSGKGRYAGGRCIKKTLLVFVDDFQENLKDEKDNQIVMELIRQYYDYQFWYDIRSQENEIRKIELSDILFVISIGFVPNRFPKINRRFLRHFSMFVLSGLQEVDVVKIFSCILFHAYRQNGFPTDVLTTATSIIQATCKVLGALQEKLKPVPWKYLTFFNLHDLEKLISGCSLLIKDGVDNKKTFPRLWIHEMIRIFGDRLIASDDQNWLFNQLSNQLNAQFNETMEGIFDNFDQVNYESLKTLYFNSFMNETGKYEEISEMEPVENFFHKALQQYNSKESIPLNLVLHPYNIDHLMKISRTLILPGQSGVLIGEYGSGKECLVRLSAMVCEFELRMPRFTLNYTFESWRQNIKDILLEIGATGKKVVFLVKDVHFSDPRMLDDVNCLICLGEIPNLFTIEEKQKVLESTRFAAQEGNQSLDVSVLEVMNFFRNRSQQNLRIMLCFSMNDEVNRKRFQTYPKLINKTMVIWFDFWPEASFIQVAEHYLTKIDIPQNEKDQVSQAFNHFHAIAIQMAELYQKNTKRTYTLTTAAYTDFLQCYIDLINDKQSEISSNKMKYQLGLDKLLFATDQVVLLSDALTKLKPQLIQMGERSVEVRKQIEHETIAVEKASFQVREEEKIANVQAADAQELKSECEADLALAIPILEDAIAALNTLKPTDITLVKSMKNPPDTIKLVMAAVCVMKEIKPDRLPDAATGRKILDYWGPSKKLLGEMNFLQQLKDFDKDEIPPHVMQKIRKEYLPNKDFQPHCVAKASSAAEGLCKWVIAMDLYDKVAKEVAPKKAKLLIAETTYGKTLGILKEKRLLLSELEERLTSLNIQLEQAHLEMKRVQEEVDICTKKFQCAQRLVHSLEGEKSYWSDTVNRLHSAYEHLVGDVLLASGLIAYFGPFDPTYRALCSEKWIGYLRENTEIIFTENFNATNMLKERSKTKVHVENFKELRENITILRYTKRYCLFIDPQLQMKMWLENLEGECLIKTKLNDVKFLNKMKEAITSGSAIMIELVGESLDIYLDVFLRRNIYLKDNRQLLNINGEELDVNETFRLYLHTTNSNPEYLSAVFYNFTIIYSPITVSTVCEQLLLTIIEKELFELYVERIEIISQTSTHRQQLKLIRQNILKVLSETKNNILEDEDAIKTLDSYKILLSETLTKQSNSQETLKRIEQICSKYSLVARHGAILYDILNNLIYLNHMYQYSINWFINLFKTVVITAPRSRDFQVRMERMRVHLLKMVHSYVFRTLFACDRIIFNFIIYIEVKARFQVDQKLIDFLITDHIELDNHQDAVPPFDWITKNQWIRIIKLSKFPPFEKLIESFQDESEKWKDYTENSQIGIPIEKDLLNLYKLLISRVFHPEQFLVQVARLLSEELDADLLRPTFFNLESTYQISNSSEPILILMNSKYSTPNILNSFKEFAQRKGYTTNLEVYSMGTKKQDCKVNELIRNVAEREFWIFLENCHLCSKKGLELIEKRCRDLSPANTNSGFRLWITTASPARNVPNFILQNSTKIAYDIQLGIRDNLINYYNSSLIKNTDYYDKCPGKDRIFHKGILGIFYFHTIIQIRKLYENFGWSSKPYMDDCDLEITLHQLVDYINNEEKKFPLKIFQYVTAVCNYGNKVTNCWDEKCLMETLQDLLSEDLFDNEIFFFAKSDKAYRLPRKWEIFDVTSHLEKIPEQHSYEILSLNAPIQDYHNLRESQDFQEKSQKFYYTLPVKEMEFNVEHRLEHFLKSLPEIDDGFKTSKKDTFFDRFLCSEVDIFKTSLSNVRKDLEELLNILQGRKVNNLYYENVLSLIKNQQVPSQWTQRNQYIGNLGNFIYLLTEKQKFLSSWIELARKSQRPETFNLNYLHFPRQIFAYFILDCLEQTSREPQHIYLEYKYEKSDDCSLVLTGLVIVGASWDSQNLCIVPPRTNSLLYEDFPDIYVLIKDNLSDQPEECYNCPAFEAVTLYPEENFENGSQQQYFHEFPVPNMDKSKITTKNGVVLALRVLH